MSALALRIIASVSMLLDHIGFCLDITPLRWIGRLAFPLYVFLLVNGFRHTKSPLRYALRLALFAVLSQIPFSLMCFDKLLHPNLNVMVTLLLALLCIWSGELLRKNKRTRWFCPAPALLMFCVYYFGYISSDYGAKGILLATVFWLFDGKELWKKLCVSIGAFFALFYDIVLQYAYRIIKGILPLSLPSKWQQVQLFALLALPLILLYNNKPGKLPQNPLARKSIQIGFYAFYPVHMLLLWALL